MSHKFSIELPKTVAQALALDAKNDNILWADAISKEMENVRVAFEILPDGGKVPIVHLFVQDFRCKVRLVAGGHITKAPGTVMYVNIVSRETVRVALIIATLNDLDFKLGDILNVYI